MDFFFGQKLSQTKMYTVYILYSKLLSKYYVGFTSMSVSDRLARHMQDHSGFTSKAKDWEILHTEVWR